MPNRVWVIKHEAVPTLRQLRGAIHRWPGIKILLLGQSIWRLRPEILTRPQALEQAQAFAMAERDKLP